MVIFAPSNGGVICGLAMLDASQEIKYKTAQARLFYCENRRMASVRMILPRRHRRVRAQRLQDLLQMDAFKVGEDGVGAANPFYGSEPNAVKAANARCLDSRRGIFKNNAFARRQVQLPRGLNEQIRRGLLPLDAIAVRDGIERMPDSKPVHHLARVLARRTESRLEPCPANFVE